MSTLAAAAAPVAEATAAATAAGSQPASRDVSCLVLVVHFTRVADC
jgi:hypothetical protein